MCTIRNPATLNVIRESLSIGVLPERIECVTLEQYNELLRKYDARGRQLARFKAKIRRLYWVIQSYRNSILYPPHPNA